MTFEDIQKTIAEMLQVQRQLQESQLELKESQLLAQQEAAQLREAQHQTDRGLDRLTNLTERFIGASSTVIDNQNRVITEIRLEQQQLTTSHERLTEVVEELRTSNRRQERLNDFLLRQVDNN